MVDSVAQFARTTLRPRAREFEAAREIPFAVQELAAPSKRALRSNRSQRPTDIRLRASETAELVLEDCRVPEENLLGGEEKYMSKEGFMTAMKTFDNTRPIVGATRRWPSTSI